MQENEIKNYYEKKSNIDYYDKLRFEGIGGKIVDKREKSQVFSCCAHLKKGSKILDVAAGTGRFSLALAEKGYSVTAFDSSRGMLEKIEDKAREKSLDVVCVSGNASSLSFDDDMFDAVISIRFLWHYKNYLLFLQEMIRVVKPGGFIFVDFFNKWSIRLLITWLTNLWVYAYLASHRNVKIQIRKLGGEAKMTSWDFFFPYLFYRKTGGSIPAVLEKIDTWMGKTFLRKLSTVFYLKINKR